MRQHRAQNGGKDDTSPARSGALLCIECHKDQANVLISSSRGQARVPGAGDEAAGDLSKFFALLLGVVDDVHVRLVVLQVGESDLDWGLVFSVWSMMSMYVSSSCKCGTVTWFGFWKVSKLYCFGF